MGEKQVNPCVYLFGAKYVPGKTCGDCRYCEDVRLTNVWTLCQKMPKRFASPPHKKSYLPCRLFEEREEERDERSKGEGIAEAVPQDVRSGS
jgi:hypothetical protein